jgi:ABC-type Mn/Zn transport systems, ATPase component
LKDTIVEVHDLTVAYNQKPVLWDIELEIPRGRLAAIVGPNGAGKTTLLKSILGLIKPISGQVIFNDLNGAPITKLKNRIGYVPQSESVDWDFPATVFDVVLMGRYGHIGWIKRPKKEDKQKALEIIKKVGLEEYADRQISQLSGGQQQRVFLARALVQDAEIYFMDEPFKGVDAKTEKVIIDLLKKLQDSGKTVIVVHHDLQTVPEYFDWVTLINLQIIANGPVSEAFTDMNLNKAYQGKNILNKGIT